MNYHFGGKKGLYDEVVRSAIETMHGDDGGDPRRRRGQPAEEQLRAYVAHLPRRASSQARDGWIHQLMMREWPIRRRRSIWSIKQVVRPRMAYLRECHRQADSDAGRPIRASSAA